MATQGFMASEYLLFFSQYFLCFYCLSLSAQPPGQYSTSTAVLGSLGLWAIVNQASEVL